MIIVSIVGSSDTGKTRLICSLIGELNKREYKVGCIKHCPCGFTLDKSEKDSHKFIENGAHGVILSSRNKTGMIKAEPEKDDPRELATKYLSGCDLVFVEGFKSSKGLKKIELLRRGIGETPKIDDSVALISDIPLVSEKKIFHPDDTVAIADFIEGFTQYREKSIKLCLNDRDIPLNPFVKKALKNSLLGFISALKRDDERIKKVDLSMEV